MNKKGLTLIELMTTLTTIAILAVVALTIYIAVLKSWSSQEKRAGISVVLDRTVAEMTRDLREAKEIDTSINNDEIRFTDDQTTYYIYYLYNASDTYPPAFNQPSYELRKETLTGVIDGTFTYGSGRLILSDVVPPTTTDLSYDGTLLTIDLSVLRDEETMRFRSKLKPRNL